MGGVDHIVGVRTQTNVNIHEVVVVLINLRKHDAVIVGAEDLAYSAPESAGLLTCQQQENCTYQQSRGSSHAR